MLSLFKSRDLYETAAFYRIEKKYREPKLWSFEVWPFSVKYCFYKAISNVIWGSFWLFLTHFWPFFPEKRGLDVLNGAFWSLEYWAFFEKSVFNFFQNWTKYILGEKNQTFPKSPPSCLKKMGKKVTIWAWVVKFFVIFVKLRFCHWDVDFRVNLAQNARFFPKSVFPPTFFAKVCKTHRYSYKKQHLIHLTHCFLEKAPKMGQK